jgi:hypothetical protein
MGSEVSCYHIHYNQFSITASRHDYNSLTVNVSILIYTRIETDEK